MRPLQHGWHEYVVPFSSFHTVEVKNFCCISPLEKFRFAYLCRKFYSSKEEVVCYERFDARSQ